MCKKIYRGGNAEQYHAAKKYKEAVAEAVEACAEDVKGQTCYICTQALHDKDATAEELTEVATILENALKIAQRVMGREHPRTGNIRHELATAREEIARRRGA